MEEIIDNIDEDLALLHVESLRLHKEIIILQQRHEDEKLERQAERQVEGFKTIYSSSWSNASAYTNLIILAGYAGFFGLLSMVKDHVAPFGIVLSSFFIGISLFIFVLFEVIKMVHVNIHFNRVIKIACENRGDVISAIGEHENRFSSIHGKFWLWTYIPTVLFGFLGVCTVLYYFFLSIKEMLLGYLG